MLPGLSSFAIKAKATDCPTADGKFHCKCSKKIERIRYILVFFEYFCPNKPLISPHETHRLGSGCSSSACAAYESAGLSTFTRESGKSSAICQRSLRHISPLGHLLPICTRRMVSARRESRSQRICESR